MGTAEVRTIMSLSDRMRDLFDQTWANAFEKLLLLPISIWLYAAILANPEQPAAEPALTWWQVRAAELGFDSPRWLWQFAAWQPAEHSDVVLLSLLVVTALATAIGANCRAPGFRILGLLALVMATQWFGLTRTLLGYVLVVGVLLSLVVCGAIRTRWHYRQRVPQYGTTYRSDMVLMGLFNGPLIVIILPLIYPWVLVGAAVRSFGVDVSRPVRPAPSGSAGESAVAPSVNGSTP